MKLVVFDIDGTLTDTAEMNRTCFYKAVKTVLNEKEFSKELFNKFQHQTDTGITMQVWDNFKGRYPRTYEVNSVKNHLLTEFSDYKSKTGSSLEIENASDLFRRLKQFKNIGIAIASDSWKVSAEYKLDLAEIAWRYLPLITSDNFISRYDILKESHNHSKVYYNVKNFEKRIYISDNDWNQEAANKAGMKFIKTSGITGKDGIRKEFPEVEEFLGIIFQM